MTRRLRRYFLADCALSVCLGIAAAGVCAQQNYPNKPVRLIVPLAPGGPSDILARTMAQKMTGGLGQPVVVDNRTGAGGTIGTDLAAKSSADGYTMLLIAAATYTINANLYPKLPFDPRKDLTPVSILAAAPYVLTVHPSLPAKSLKDLVALVKARAKDLNYGSGGTGTGPQMAMELLKLKTGMNLTHIPYKGTGPALTEQIAGQVQVGLFNMIAALPVVQSGRLRALAVSGAKRSTRLPNIPTIAESGVPGFEEVSGHMIMVPTATPKEIVARLHQEMIKALQSPEVKSRLESEGADIIGNTPEQAAAIIRSDLEKWADVIRRTGIKAD
ncbi:MAG TPA: tripartite tricarboxylate transporter substrate binding protein [Burkholderiales bacterium]|nr:tripartite tricarboxylate transporter substrate binding protein [Burkholderiales bacterium]